MPPGLAINSTKIALVFGRERGAERFGIGGVGPPHLPAAFLEGMGELVDRAAIKLARGDELVARLEQGMEHQRLRRVARGDGKPRRAAFERRHPLLQHRLGRVADAGIDVAEGLEIEQRRGVLDVVEHEGRGLIDRRGARAGGGIGLGAGMDGKRVEAGLSLRGHRHVPLMANGRADYSKEPAQAFVASTRCCTPLAPEQRALARQRAGIHAGPGELAGQPAIFDLRAAIHHHLQAGRPRRAPPPRRCARRAASTPPWRRWRSPRG